MEANEHYLNEHMEEVDVSERAQDWKENYIEELLAEGGELYPFGYFNILEALENRTDAQALNLTSVIATYSKQPENQFVMASTANVIVKIIYDYWKEAAEKKADSVYSVYYNERKYG